MENKKKQWVYVGIIVVSLGVASWLLIGKNVFNSEDVLEQSGNIFVTAEQSVERQNLLPYGTKFDTSITSDPQFLKLVPAVRLQVSDSELGKANPFVP